MTQPPRRLTIVAVLILVLLLLLLSTCLITNTEAAVACNSTRVCGELLLNGSECIEGYCSNPYTKGGCLVHRVPSFTKLRVCNSEDPPQHVERGYCRLPYAGLEYTEIRLFGQNWESAFFIAWIQQILLSELLDVPTTLESGVPGKKINFYDSTNALDYGIGYDWDGFTKAWEVVDCRLTNESCGHVMSEVWQNRRAKVEEMEAQGVVEPFSFLGVFGKGGWYVPKFTGQRDPSLLTWLGLTGEANRQKLALTFQAPTTWHDYCTQVSSNNCTIPNNITSRAPMTKEEGVQYFVPNLYTGHFRATDANNCTKFPTNCTGHFVDFPCGWSSVFQSQAYHNHIALNTSGDEPFGSGYSYPRLIEIWHAANATRSNVMGHWWQPEALYQEFLGTPMEFQKVDLPPATLECLQARINIDEDRCFGDFVRERGDALGACDDPDQALMKVISTSLYKATFDDPSIEEAQRSPGYQAIKDFRFDALQLEQVFKLWQSPPRGRRPYVDRYGFDPRDAACVWVSQNLDFLQSFIPKTYPRVTTESNSGEEPIGYAALVLGSLSVALVCVSCILTYTKRNKALIRMAQVEFMYLLLAGLLLVSIAAILSSLTFCQDLECIAIAWLINVGYTLELVPLIVKVAAINRLMQAAKQMRRLNLKRSKLFGYVFILSALVVVFMVLWTVLDPPTIVSSYVLTNEVNNNGETIVAVSKHCQSNSDAWVFVSLGFQGFLLFCASILAFQMRKLQHELNESQTLAIMIYSHFLFFVLRLITFVWLEKSEFAPKVAGIRGLLLGADSVTAICIYFFPKFFFKDTDTTTTRRRVSMEEEEAIRTAIFTVQRNDEKTSGGPTAQDPESAAVPNTKRTSFVHQEVGKLIHCPHCGKSIHEDKGDNNDEEESKSLIIKEALDRLSSAADLVEDETPTSEESADQEIT